MWLLRSLGRLTSALAAKALRTAIPIKPSVRFILLIISPPVWRNSFCRFDDMNDAIDANIRELLHDAARPTHFQGLNGVVVA